MALHLSEEEQLDALKQWWKENGLKTVALIAALGFGYLGWSQYGKHVEQKAVDGSKIYETFINTSLPGGAVAPGEALSAEARKKLADLSSELNTKFDDSLYARLASLHMAKLAVENNDLETARTHLESVLEHSKLDALDQLTRIRLARLTMAQGQYDQALKHLETPADPAFVDSFAELRGDIHTLAKNYGDARIAYQEALDAITDPRSMQRSLIEMKLDNATLDSDVVETPMTGDLQVQSSATEGV